MANTQLPLPSPPPPLAVGVPVSVSLNKADSQQLMMIEALMVLAVVMSCLLLLGSLRKRTSNAFLRNSLWAVVVSTPLFISYVVGQMMNKSRMEEKKLFPIWGILLLTGLASYGTISAFEIEDNENAVSAFVQGFVKCSFVFAMLVGFNGAKIPLHLNWMLHILVPIIMLKLIDRALSMGYASKTNLYIGVGPKTKGVSEFMAWDVEKTLQAEEEEAIDPKTMTGYRYLVGIKSLLKKQSDTLHPCFNRNFEKNKETLVTTEEIWKSDCELLSSTRGGRLKDMCLSFALFWMLLRRYAGHPIAEVTSLEMKTWNFVRYGLTPDLTPDTSERAFSVIEQELSFLYDYFYTKNFTTYLFGIPFMVIRFIIMAAVVLVAQLILKNHQDTLPLVMLDHLPPIRVDIVITQIVINAMLLFEIVIMVHYLIITPWSRVEWVCTYVRKKLWESQTWKDRCLRWGIERLCRFSSLRNFKHWKREIGQYTLVMSHDYISSLHYLRGYFPLGLFEISTRGRIASESIPFSIILKTALLSSLHTNGRYLSNGKSSLQKYKLDNDFSWACNLETHTQTILVWHIATSFCEQSHPNQDLGTLNPDSRLVATSLSKYCGYLVTFAPELLPDNASTTFNIINHVILDANEMFQGCSDMEAKFEKMRALPEYLGDYDKGPILEKGIWLGKTLSFRMRNETLWEMLAEFWAELLLYLAPSDDVASHIKHLANGGELITHLWTLLTHAGIIKRDG